MEFIIMKSDKDKLWEDAWHLYSITFPEHEKRSKDFQQKAMKDMLNIYTKE